MKHIFTFKSAFIALLVMICSTAKAETVEYETDGFRYSLNTETQEATLSKYLGDATKVVVSEKVTYEGKEYTVTSLGGECFYRCLSLTSIDIPSSVTSLGNCCFLGCSSLVSIDIPSSVTSLGAACFAECSSLKSIEIPTSVESLGGWFFYRCSSLESIVIPSSVTSLGNLCFCSCSSLKSIEIPSSVTSLGNFCFSCCDSLKSIVIPSSVTSLGDYCFSECSSLKAIICKMEDVVSNNLLFYLTPIKKASLYVSEHLLETYKSTSTWSDFGTILPLAEEPETRVNDIAKSDLLLRSNNGIIR